MFSAGDHIGDFRILAPIRAGGMGTLFLARREGVAGFARPVAIKVVHAHLADDPKFVEMFLEEARLSARIAHPNVVHVEDLGEIGGAYFLVMEYVPGCSLLHVLRALARGERRMAPELSVYLAIQVADGLHAAHDTVGDRGEPLDIVHRDVTPQNVMIAYRGHVKIIDFGIAKARGRAEQTALGSLRGKLGYMSPEQAWGRDLDRRADIYSLGVVLWEMLTTRRLFQSDDEMRLIERVRHPDVTPPGRIATDIPAALDEAVMVALAPDRRARPRSMQAFRRLLADAMPGALALDASHVAELVSALLPEEIDRERARLTAGELSDDALPPSSAATPRSALHTLTALTADAIPEVSKAKEAARARRQSSRRMWWAVSIVAASALAAGAIAWSGAFRVPAPARRASSPRAAAQPIAPERPAVRPTGAAVPAPAAAIVDSPATQEQPAVAPARARRRAVARRDRHRTSPPRTPPATRGGVPLAEDMGL